MEHGEREKKNEIKGEGSPRLQHYEHGHSGTGNGTAGVELVSESMGLLCGSMHVDGD
jgi:hypothetical protein